MDKSAVWSASERDLVKLGLTERGDIIYIKSYCVTSNIEEQKDELLTVISNTGKERVNKKSRLSKAASIGRMHFNCMRGMFVLMRTKEEGCGDLRFQVMPLVNIYYQKQKRPFLIRKRHCMGM